MAAMITKTTVLDLEPVHANWVVTVEREDYADPAEESGVLLHVGRTTVMLTVNEALAIGAALGCAATVSPEMRSLMVALADTVTDKDEADDPEPGPCERCGGSGTHMGDNPGTYRHHDCAECDGRGVAA